MEERYEKPLWDEIEQGTEKTLDVLYKDWNYRGELEIKSEEYRSWDEIGKYTAFYSDVSHDSLALLVPTENVIKIVFNRFPY